jgi:hypothetical protein
MSMQTPDLSLLNAHIARLEARIRWLTALVVLFAAAGVGYAVIGNPMERQAEPSGKSLEGESFFLKGHDGSTSAMLTNAKKGPLLFIDKEKRSIQLQVTNDGSGLEVRDETATLRARMAVQKDDASINLFDAQGKSGASVSVGKSGSALALYDENGKPRIRLGVTKNGPEIKLLDESGKTVASKPFTN